MHRLVLVLGLLHYWLVVHNALHMVCHYWLYTTSYIYIYIYIKKTRERGNPLGATLLKYYDI